MNRDMTRPRRRLPPNERRRAIVTGAARFFATHGFSGTTRALADDLGVTQALLYRYFPTKDALIGAVFEDFVGRWEPDYDRLLRDRTQPLAERLTAFYTAYLGRNADYNSTRLFMHAALAGLDFPERYVRPLNERLLGPVCRELRHEAGMTGIEDRPMTPLERELVLALHSGLVHLNMRRHIFHTQLPAPFGEIVALHVESWLGGALPAIRRLAG